MPPESLRCSSRTQRMPRGASLIELMVGIVIALLVSLTAVNSAIFFNAAQRQGIGAAGTAINAASVLGALRDDVAVAGLGFFGDSTYLCNTLNFSSNTSMEKDGVAFSPLQVTRTTEGDTLDLIFGTRVESGANVRLRAGSTGANAALESFLPVAVNEAVLLAPSVPDNSRPCLVRTVTANTPSTSNAAQLLAFDATGKHNALPFTTNPGFDDDGRVTQLGVVNWSRYRVSGGNLLLEKPLEGSSAIIARGVISFRVQYGVSPAAGVDSLEDWVDPAGLFAAVDAATLPRVRAMRIGLILRSPQPEKRNAAGNCVATETKPVLWPTVPPLPPRAAENLANPDWNCWRYRTSTVVVPLRNLVLGQQ